MESVGKNKWWKSLSLLLVAVLVLTAGIQSAYAIPTLKLSDGISTITIGDNMSGDTSSVEGIVRYFGNLGVFDILVTVGSTKPAIGSATSPELDIFSLQLSSSAAGNLTVKFSETDFGPVTGSLITEVGGITDGFVSFDTYVDDANALFGTGTLVSSINTIHGSGSGAISYDSFSITSLASIIHDNAGDFTSFNMFVSVPELETTYLLGMCLLGLAGIQWRKRSFL